MFIKEHKKELTKALNRAKIGIMSIHNSSFICTILFSLKQFWTEDLPTAGVNGVSLAINPKFFLKLTSMQRIFLLAHESWHVAFQHMLRGKKYDHEKYNAAADYVINLMLQDNNYELVKGCFVDNKYRGMSTEDVYKLLPDIPPSNNLVDIIYKEIKDKKDITDQKSLEAHIKSIIIKASLKAKMNKEDIGNIPGEILVSINEMLNPKLPWEIILMNYMREHAKEDYSMAKPNRRFMPNFYLPSLYSEKLMNLSIAIDVSGSVSDKQITCYLTEIKHLKEQFNPAELIIYGFDTKIRDTHIVTPDVLIENLKFTGRGGTNLYPLFDQLNITKPSIVIIFSDLFCKPIQETPTFPVIWVVVDNKKAEVNFGQVIHYDSKDR